MPFPRENDACSVWLHDLFQGAIYCYLSGLIVLLGVAFGNDVIQPLSQPKRMPTDLASGCVRFDGHHYCEIADRGYQYDPSRRSTVAFFPAYPLTVRAFNSVFGSDTKVGLLAVSNLGLLGSFVLLGRYLRVHPVFGAGQPGWILLVFGVWPTTFFFRMAYAESLFVLCSLVVLYGIARRWPFLLLAVSAGLASATRPVGVAVSAACLWHLVRQPGPWHIRACRMALFGPIACWGLLAYMAYQYAAFGHPLAFAQTQVHWTNRAPVQHPALSEKCWSLATFEPVVGVYNPDSRRYWGRYTTNNPLFSMAFWNPLLFVLAAGLVVYGAARRWLTGPEVVLGAAALAIPYLTRAYEMSMASHGRFAAAAVPAYLVAGRLLAIPPPPMAAAIAACSAAVLACWSALYAAGHSFF